MTPKYDRVLVTTDFSKWGDAAIPHAYALVGRGPGTVVLCHVLERPQPPNPLYAHYSPVRTMTPAEREALAEQLAQKLKRSVPGGVPRSVKTEVRVLETSEPVHEAIVGLARRSRVKAIVISSHGQAGLRRLFLGSTTERVLRCADRPVFVVRS
ncbi:MAG: universal stress protein [Planctomycetota bacterium]